MKNKKRNKSAIKRRAAYEKQTAKQIGKTKGGPLMKNKSQKKDKKTAFSHDSFFKFFFSKPELARELVRLIFSEKELSNFDLGKIKIEKDTFGTKRADLILSLPFKTHPDSYFNLFILLEHKSYYDKNLFSQMLDYQVLMRKHHIAHFKRPMPSLSVVFAHGQGPAKWKKTLQEEDYGERLPEIPLEFRKNMLNCGLIVIKAQDEKVQKICREKRFKSRGVIRLLAEICGLKDMEEGLIPDKVKGIIIEFEDMLKELKGKERETLVLMIWDYLIEGGGLSEEVVRKIESSLEGDNILQKEGGKKFMDIRAHIKERSRLEGWREGRLEGQREGLKKGFRKGRQEGRLEGRREVALNMMKKKLDISAISEATDLSIAEIKKLKNGS